MAVASDRLIVAGDIGGTSTRLAPFAATDERPRPACETVYRSREYPGLDEIVQAFEVQLGKFAL
jgi:glucokinase